MGWIVFGIALGLVVGGYGLIRRWRRGGARRPAAQQTAAAADAAIQPTRLDWRGLRSGCTYVVIRDIRDFHGQQFLTEERLRYLQHHFVPYHGGHTLVFEERSMFLQEALQRDILEALPEYLQTADLSLPPSSI